MWVYLVVWGTGYTDAQGSFGIACEFTGVAAYLIGCGLEHAIGTGEKTC